MVAVKGGGGAKGPPPYQFSPVTSTNVAIIPQNLLTFSFNHFDTLAWNFKAILSVSPKLFILSQGHPSKKVFFSGQIKTIFKDSKELKELKIMHQNAVYISISWYSKIRWFPVKNCWCQQNSRGVSRDLYIFGSYLRKV